MEELREAMNKNELETFLTIHIREGAWQVVLLFMDELPKYKLLVRIGIVKCGTRTRTRRCLVYPYTVRRLAY